MTDARIVRTRAALHDAILGLASERSVSRITVSELANAAGINRVTFYKHFATPSAALNSALAQELIPRKAQFITRAQSLDEDPLVVLWQGFNALFDHIDRHRAIYSIAASDTDDGSLMGALGEYYTRTVLEYLRIRKTVDPPLPEFDIELVASFYGHGFVGAVKLWLQRGAEDRRAFFETITNAAPSWWMPEHPVSVSAEQGPAAAQHGTDRAR